VSCQRLLMASCCQDLRSWKLTRVMTHAAHVCIQALNVHMRLCLEPAGVNQTVRSPAGITGYHGKVGMPHPEAGGQAQEASQDMVVGIMPRLAEA
jgi:hypothetical protein